MHKERNSNIELMRIIAMLFIISHHFLVHGMKIWEDTSWDNLTLLSIDSFFFVGVNVFVLISGYSRIRFDLNKLLRIYVLTAIIGGVGYFAHLLIDNASLGRSLLYNTIFSISHTPGTWFIKTYIFLFLLSPILNTALDHFDKKQMRLVLLLLTGLCVYFGWFWQDNVNKDGYNLINFIWIYFIGYYLRHYYDVKKLKPIYYLVVWGIASISNAILFIVYDKYVAWTYNNPLVVLAAIALFLFFVSFNFSSKPINFIAQSTLGIYLLHENAYLSPLLYKPQCIQYYSTNIFNFIISVLTIFFVCALIDNVLRHFIANPILKIPPVFARKHNKS